MQSAPVHILAVCGSLQAQSSNLTLVRDAARLAPEGCTVTVSDALRTLPHFNPDLGEGDDLPSVVAWRAAIAGSDAVLIATPEYGHSLPGALKNGIDWVIGSGELERKIVAITASTNYAQRGKGGLLALRTTLQAVSACILGGEPIVRGPEAEADLRALLVSIVEQVREAAESGHPRLTPRGGADK